MYSSVRYDPVLVIIECPQAFHVPSYAEVCTPEPWPHIGRSLHPSVLHPFVQDILIFDVPFIEGTDETQAPMKLSLSILVMPLASERSPREASMSGLPVR